MYTPVETVIEDSVLTAVITLAAKYAKERPCEMSQASFERSIARKIAKQATTVANLNDESLEVVRESVTKKKLQRRKGK